MINRQPVLVASSPALLPAWLDKAPHHVVTGVWHTPMQSALSPAIQQFIDHDTPYIVATLSASPAANESRVLYDMVVEVAAQLGVRLLLQVPAHVTHLRNNDAVARDALLICPILRCLNVQVP
jgi:UDP:flavonoid glycosyltransferase YjiC (YdhE family)